MALRFFHRLIQKPSVISATKSFCRTLSTKPHKVIVLQNGNGREFARFMSNGKRPSSAAPPDDEDTQCAPTWNTYLYQLQQQAPKPICIPCYYEVPNRPPQYGIEYHGNISRQEADRLLYAGDGCYLVRKSDRGPDEYTLAIRFDNITRNYKLYYDGKHYVGDKMFDSVHELVEDGLINFYIEQRASDYIDTLSEHSVYEESPYMSYNTKKNLLWRNSAGEDTSSKYAIDQSSPATDVAGFEKPHVLKVHNFIGRHWCDFCGNFLWGLRAQGVKCKDCGVEAHKKCSEKLPDDCTPNMKYVKRIFGADLTTVVKAQKSLIPIVVEKCVKEIELRGLDIVGIYRLAGSHQDIEVLRMQFDKDVNKTDISAKKYENINTVCSVLKLYFRLLPIPLITHGVHRNLVQIVKAENFSAQEQEARLKEQLMSLPPAHFHTFKFLCAHLDRVAEHESVNKMTIDNLAIVFAPTLMRSDFPDPTAALLAAKFEHKVMGVILSGHTKLLGN